MHSLQQTSSWETSSLSSLSRTYCDHVLAVTNAVMCRLAPHLHSSRTWCYHVLAATNAVMNKSHSTDWLPCLHSSRTWHCHVLAATNTVMAYLPPWQEMWHQQLHKTSDRTLLSKYHKYNTICNKASTTPRQDRSHAVSTHCQCGQSFKSCRLFK